MKHRRKKHHKTAPRRRSGGARVSGLDITTVFSAIVGGIGANALNKIIPATVSPKMIAGLKIAAGLAIPAMVKSGKAKQIAAGVGTGMAVVGTLDLMKSFGVLNGADDEMLTISMNGDEDFMSGTDDLNVVNGTDDLNVVNGDEFDQV